MSLKKEALFFNQCSDLSHHLIFNRKLISSLLKRYLIILAGTPATMEKGGTSLVTTACANTIAPSPIVTPAKIEAPNPIQQSFPIITAYLS